MDTSKKNLPSSPVLTCLSVCLIQGPCPDLSFPLASLSISLVALLLAEVEASVTPPLAPQGTAPTPPRKTSGAGNWSIRDWFPFLLLILVRKSGRLSCCSHQSMLYEQDCIVDELLGWL